MEEQFWNRIYDTASNYPSDAGCKITTGYVVMEGLKKRSAGIRWRKKTELEISLATIAKLNRLVYRKPDANWDLSLTLSG